MLTYNIIVTSYDISSSMWKGTYMHRTYIMNSVVFIPLQSFTMHYSRYTAMCIIHPGFVSFHSVSICDHVVLSLFTQSLYVTMWFCLFSFSLYMQPCGFVSFHSVFICDRVFLSIFTLSLYVKLFMWPLMVKLNVLPKLHVLAYRGQAVWILDPTQQP